MGYALINSGGTDGRYSIDLDFGSATRAGMLARLAQIQVSLNAKIAAQQLEVNAADSREAAALANLVIMQDALILAMQSGGGDSLGDPAKQLYDHLLGLHKRAAASNGPIRRALATLKLQLSQANAMVAYWNNFSATETRNAWCCDLTEDATGYVATLEIPGEPGLILIAPGGRAWQHSDGEVNARQIMSPAQAFFNAAILPGWQKWMPTYRWATVDAVNAETLDITFGAAASSAGRLDVNEASTLQNVPVSYMECGAAAFREGDRCVVQFAPSPSGRARWSASTCEVIGFLDNPRRCGTLRPWQLNLTESKTDSAETSGYGFLFTNESYADFIFANDAAIVCSARVNAGSWLQLDKNPVASAWESVPPSGFFGSGALRVGVSNVPPLPFGVGASTRTGEVQIGDVIEIKLEFGGKIIHNVAVQAMGVAGLTLLEENSSFRTYGGGTGYARSMATKQMDPNSPNDIATLTGYLLDVES